MIYLLGALCLVSCAAALCWARRIALLSRALRNLDATQRANLEAAYRNSQRSEARLQALRQEYDTLLACCEAGILILDPADTI